MKYLKLLAKSYGHRGRCREIINLTAIQNLPKARSTSSAIFTEV